MITPVLPSVAELTSALEQTATEIAALLVSVAAKQDWKPGDDHWSFRYIAAHMEACELECVLVRLRQIVADPKAEFDFYDNDGWDFDDRDLLDSVEGFERGRAQIIAFARSLSPDRLARTGHHRTFGDVSVQRYLRIDLNHDREHLQDIKEMITTLGRGV